MSGLKDDFVDEDMRGTLVASVRSMIQILNPASFATRWDQVQQTCLNEHGIRLLRSFSQTARRYRPLRAIQSGEIESIVTSIDEAVLEIDEDTDVPPWAKKTIRDGLKRLKFMMLHFDFFGHEDIIDYVIRINADAEALSKQLKDIGVNIAGNFWKTAKVVATVVGVLVAPIKAHEAYIGYKGAAHYITQHVPLLLAPPLKQITGPTESKGAPEKT